MPATNPPPPNAPLTPEATVRFPQDHPLAQASPKLNDLLRAPELGLVLKTPAEMGSDTPLRWVQSSDLTDPTPFLSPEALLLTTGGWLSPVDPQKTQAATVTTYVERLAARGVRGIGFGVGIHHDQVPPALISACEALAIPLCEVPYPTPFLAITHLHAKLVQQAEFARHTWARQTQRALALAALRPNGVQAVIAQLAQRLNCWVGLFDVTGDLATAHPTASVDAHSSAEVHRSVDYLLSRGVESSQTLMLGEHPFTLFSIGHSGQLRGVLALQAAHLDREARAVVTSVLAMVGLAHTHDTELVRAQLRLNSQVLLLLLRGEHDLARAVNPGLPTGQIVVAALEAPEAQVVGELLPWLAQRAPTSFIAPDQTGNTPGVAVLVLAAEPPPEPPADPVAPYLRQLTELAEHFGLRAGVSAPSSLAELAHGLNQATSMLYSSAEPGVSEFFQAQLPGVLSQIVATQNEALAATAAAHLAPLRASDPSGELEHTLRVWLGHSTHNESAAQAIGIHRHTLRSRLALISKLLQVDLSTFPAQAEIWASLLASPTAAR